MKNELFSAQLFPKLEEFYASKFSEDGRPVYVINSALGNDLTSSEEVKAVAILIPGYRIILVNLSFSEDDFNHFFEDFIEDVSYLSEKYAYREKIGRSRQWRNIFSTEKIATVDDLDNFRISDEREIRVGELLISLLIGSINDIEKKDINDIATDIIQKVKQRITLFDCDQTSFLYADNLLGHMVQIQGLSGTGKTELLLHKLKDTYIKDPDSKIFFTCHNRALANDLKDRIPHFFDFMKVEKQIDWNKRLWVDRAWGSANDKNSGLYSYICDFYQIPFLRWSRLTDYQTIFSDALDKILKITPANFEPAFDYIFIDERQDFPDVFFELCERITRKKVFAAGDIFQNIYLNAEESTKQFDIVLNRCYRTDPRTLMFAHAIGMALFEPKKLNFFKPQGWENLGYTYEMIDAHQRLVHLSRQPVRRFQNLEDDYESMIFIQKQISTSEILNAINEIKTQFPTVQPHDIAIIALDNDEEVFNFFDQLTFAITKRFGWDVNRGHETKHQIDGALYLTNTNNVKGLEFPFVICFSKKIQNTIKYRNTLYTMLTRSFIQSYLIVQPDPDLDVQVAGLEKINNNGYIETIEPTEEEMEKISSDLKEFEQKPRKNANEIINEVFNRLNIVNSAKRQKIRDSIQQTNIDLTDESRVAEYVQSVLSFY